MWCSAVRDAIPTLMGVSLLPLQVSPGDLVRCAISGVGEDTSSPAVLGLAPQKRCSATRCWPDSWSKVLFQSLLRRGAGALPVEAFIQVVAYCTVS